MQKIRFGHKVSIKYGNILCWSLWVSGVFSQAKLQRASFKSGATLATKLLSIQTLLSQFFHGQLAQFCAIIGGIVEQLDAQLCRRPIEFPYGHQ